MEIQKWRSKTNHTAGELSDPEVNDFVEYLHTAYELGVEE